MNLVRSQLREQQAAAINTNGQQQQQQQQQQQRAMMPAPGLPPNLTSCRLEARQELAGNAPTKTMEIQKFAEIQNSGSSSGGNAYMEDIEAVEPPALAIERKVDSSAYPAPSLALVEEEEEEEEEEEVAMAITNVEATMDTSITTP